MPKFLRSICGYHDAEIEQAIGRARAIYVLPMYEYYVTPLQTDGCAKLNICFRQKPPSAKPSLVMDIATIEWPFSLKAFVTAPPNTQIRYVLDQAHAALLAAGTHFGWPLDRARTAYDLIVQKAIRFQFVWRKPKASADRKLRVQVEVDFADTVKLYVTFLDRKGQELLRKLFSVVAPGPGLGTVAAVLGRIEWQDNTSVKITHLNGRDYWICRTEGTVEFFYPRARNGDPHGLFELGRMYCEGRYVLRDLAQGRQLVEEAAEKGYAHAANYLRKLVGPGALPNGGPTPPLSDWS
jgi:hypothetical protein